MAAQITGATPFPNLRHVVREIRRSEIVLHIRPRAVGVRAVDELGGVAEADGLVLGAVEVLAPPDAGAARVHVERARGVADALDHDEPARALREHVVADALGRVPPVGVGVALAPRARVRLVVQVGGENVPMPTERRRQLGPRGKYALLRHRVRVPEALARPGVAIEAVACHHDQNAVLRGNLRCAASSASRANGFFTDFLAQCKSRHGSVVFDGKVVTEAESGRRGRAFHNLSACDAEIDAHGMHHQRRPRCPS
eukprot:5042433-Pleurochrysis_carterae.AAC.2